MKLSLSSKKTTQVLGQKMPREQRDVLFILAVITFILIPHFFYLPIWTTVLTLSIFLWRAWISKDPARKLPGKLILSILMIVFIGLTFVTYKSIVGPEAGACLLVTLMALKTLELRARRDALVIFYLGFFLIMIGFFHSQSIITGLMLLIGFTCLLAALINAHMFAGYPPLKDAFKVAIRLVLWGAPLMLLLFMVFPRLSPLWGLPDSSLSKTGVSDTLSINSISELVKSDAIAFRIKFEGDAPKKQEMYYRGPVLDYFNGSTWHSGGYSSSPRSPSDQIELRHDNKPIEYEITMEMTNQPWLFTLDISTNVVSSSRYRTYMTQNYQWFAREIIMERIRYNGTAYTNYRIGVTPSPYPRANLRLPENSNPKTQQWAQQLMQDAAFTNLDTRGKAAWILQIISNEEYFYTLTPPRGYTAQNSADQFWFDYKSGFCEHYASSFVILMRALNIPARIVTGYHGGELNYIDEHWIVRQSDAHAWTEIWDVNEGWIRIDPTAAIAPHRILIDRTEQDLSTGLSGLSFVGQFMMRWDALENMWNQWVLAYDTDTGINLLERIGFKAPNILTLLKVMLGIMAATLLLALAAYKWKHRQKDIWLKSYAALCKKLSGLGLDVTANTSPRTVMRQLHQTAQSNPSYKEIEEILLELEKLRYAPSSYQNDLREHIKHLNNKIKKLNFKS